MNCKYHYNRPILLLQIIKPTKIICIISIFLSVSQKNYSQEIDSYKFAVHATYLPDVTGQEEYYSKEKKKLAHKAVHYTSNIGNHKKKKKIKLNNVDIQSLIYQLDSLLKLDEFSFAISDDIINYMKAASFYKENYSIQDSDIEKFTLNNKVTLNIKDIKIDVTDYLSGQIDGAYYRFELTIKNDDNELIKNELKCGSGGISNFEIKEWLVLFLIFRDYNLFETLPELKEYVFSEEKLANIIFRFIVWTTVVKKQPKFRT
jgi:hypothetical protein